MTQPTARATQPSANESRRRAGRAASQPSASLASFAVLSIFAVFLASCSPTSTITPVPTSTVGPSDVAGPTSVTPIASAVASVPTASAGQAGTPTPTTATPPGTTATAWGRIWDRLPATFPRYPGAEPADAGGGAASAVLLVPTKAAAAATWYRSALEQAGYHTKAVNGPLEDGSVVIDWTGASSACRVQAGFAPRGNQVIATILFAAACPFR